MHQSPVKTSVTQTTTTGVARGTNYQVNNYAGRSSGMYGSGIKGSQVIETREGPSRFVEERYVGERVVNVSERAMEQRLIHAERP